MVRVHAARKSLAILGTALAAAAACLLLPDNPYQRWQLLDGTIHANARWIYERSHFDPTPIDVMFVGPSRVGSAVDAPLLGRRLAALGQPANVVNFSLPEGGRNINAAIVETALETKTPRLIVIGVIEKPSRLGHSAFKYIAPTRDIVAPGYLGDPRYLSNLVYLPYRQMVLFGANLMPDAFAMPKRFDRSRYPGASVDTTGDVVMPDGSIKNGTSPASAAELERGVRKLEGGMTPPMLPESLADVEFGDERHNIRRIVALARAKDVPVAFLALPYHTGPDTLQEEAFYRQYGTIWNAGFLSPRPELFADYGHLTAGGADVLTDWLAPRVAAALEAQR